MRSSSLQRQHHSRSNAALSEYAVWLLTHSGAERDHSQQSEVTTLFEVGCRVLPEREMFQADFSLRDGGVVVLDLYGELDLVSMPKFEKTLDALLSGGPQILIVDLSGSDFVCAAGYEAIGRCSRHVERLIVCSRGEYTRKILGILGYRDVAYIDLGIEAAWQTAPTWHE